MSDRLLEVVCQGVTIHDLGRPMFAGMPQSPNHPAFFHALPRRHGDMVRPGDTSPANDVLILGGHVGTHVDALAHVAHEGLLHGGLKAADEVVGGRFMTGGVHQVRPAVCRGLLLDVPAALGLNACEPAYEITPADLEATIARQGIRPRPGDILSIRSGWGRHWDDPRAYVGSESGLPGVGEDGARWLAHLEPRAVGADTIAFERQAPGVADAPLPAHRVLLVEAGINIIETLNLEEISALGLFEFTFILIPLAIVGATGSPVRPIAVVGAS